MEYFEKILENALFLLIVINPVSKILIINSLIGEGKQFIKNISVKSSYTGLIILIIFAVGGNFILRNIFRINIYSLQIAGGIILFLFGLNALLKGGFGIDEKKDKEEIAMITLASMIAGPGTITATISLSAVYGVISVCISIILAIFINFILMIYSIEIGKLLGKNLLGPLVRLTGFFISSIGMNMAFTGIKEFLK